MFTENDVCIIGLTGMSGAGKTTACEVFRECGYGVINCDTVARIVVEKGRPALRELEDYFGSSVILQNGELNRKYIGNLIFSDEKARFAFNDIIYPYISYEMIMSAVEYIKMDSKYILLDAPTLFESGTDSFCDIIVSVVSDMEKCLERIMQRDKLTYEEALNRLSSQFPPEFYKQRSDYCVENKGSVEQLKTEIKNIAVKIGEINEQKKKQD